MPDDRRPTISNRISEAIALTAGEFTDLAAEVGVSRHTIYSWADGRRQPSPENLAAFVHALRERSERLRHLADELKRVAEASR